ncbi:MAG: DUF2306 domain-containing protein [Roseivirga sp.]|nr:DUF2306 domain-containing protein [Roseivirga sp.]
MKFINILGWFFFILLAIVIGLYPFGYVISDTLTENGLLSQKPEGIRTDQIWYVQFYVHIILGGVALLTGWSQFLKRFRSKNLGTHRLLGKVYMIAVMLSGLSGLYIALYAEGGIVAKAGFAGLALSWLFTTSKAYIAVRRGQINPHKKWMIRSYALTFAAVTLRIWLPMFQFGFGMDFISAYVIIAWLCWVPNIIWAEWKVSRI